MPITPGLSDATLDSAEEAEFVHYLNQMERVGLASLMCVYFLNFLLLNDRAILRQSLFIYHVGAWV
jgi:hypothetical protein